VTASVFGAGGSGEAQGYWATVIKFEPDPAATVKPCYVDALDEDSDVAGWLYVELATSPGSTSSTKLLESSPLPPRLTACIVARLRAIHTQDGMSPMKSVVYVSLEPSAITAPRVP
jgi:hypothetical protein